MNAHDRTEDGSSSGSGTASPFPERATTMPDARRVAAILASLAVVCSAAWFVINVPIGNVDVSWLLVVCGRVLDGARLHADIVEINPPLSVWLYMPFVLAERVIGLRAEFWMTVGVCGLAVLSVWMCVRIAQEDRPRRLGLMPAGLISLLWLFPRDFGQREQVAVIALLPWLALLASRDRHADFSVGTGVQRVLAGLGAAVFVALKPPLSVFALLVPILWLCVVRRDVRPVFTTENVVGALVVLSYLAWLAAFHQAFFTDILPIAQDFYLPARMSAATMLTLTPVATFSALVVAVLAAAHPGRVDRGALLLLLSAAGYLPVFVLLGKGWPYQALPTLTLGVLALFLQISRAREATRPGWIRRIGIAAGLLVVANILGPELVAPRRISVDAAAAAIDGAVRSPTIGSIATRLQPAHPLTRMVEGQFVARYPAFWFADNAAGLIRTTDPARGAHLAALRDRMIDDLATEMARLRPDVIVDGGTRLTQGQKDVHDNPHVARMLASYRLLYRDDETTIWLRSDPSSAAESEP